MDRIKNEHSQISTYRKIHLFDVDLSEHNGPILQESKSTMKGTQIEEPIQVDAEGASLNVALSIVREYAGLGRGAFIELTILNVVL
jgi:hypothetical protein